MGHLQAERVTEGRAWTEREPKGQSTGGVMVQQHSAAGTGVRTTLGRNADSRASRLLEALSPIFKNYPIANGT